MDVPYWVEKLGPSIIALIAGGGSAWFGYHLTGKREEAREQARRDTEASYVAALVLIHLDRYIDACIDVVRDDGMSEGEPAGRDGRREPVEREPDFNPHTLKGIDWKSIPPDLTYEIFNLEYRSEQLSAWLALVADLDGPPDYDDYFMQRRLGFARLGIHVHALAERLRKNSGLPTSYTDNEKETRADTLRKKLEELEAKSRAGLPGVLLRVERDGS